MAEYTVEQQARLNRQTAQDQAQIGNVPEITPYGRVDYHGTPGTPGYYRSTTLNPTLQTALSNYQQSQALASNQGYYRLHDFNARRGPIDENSFGVRGSALTPGALPAGGTPHTKHTQHLSLIHI